MRVIAVVVHWRDVAETRGCLEALAAAGVEALIVDNGSPEPIGPGFAAAALTVRSTVNVGYAGGANPGPIGSGDPLSTISASTPAAASASRQPRVSATSRQWTTTAITRMRPPPRTPRACAAPSPPR